MSSISPNVLNIPQCPRSPAAEKDSDSARRLVERARAQRAVADKARATALSAAQNTDPKAVKMSTDTEGGGKMELHQDGTKVKKTPDGGAVVILASQAPALVMQKLH
eukprot:gene15218-biopygen3216